jgi:DNA-binding transcriptional ArsR family regulator
MDAGNGGRIDRLPADQVDLAVEVFRMLADATRVQILWALINRELSMARLVRTRREGTTIFYRLDNEHVARLITDAVYNAEHAGPGVPGHHSSEQIRVLPPETRGEAR